MAGFQIWLERTLRSINPVAAFMHSKWGWPAAESIHFIGLSLLIGTIAVFDLRLLGLGKRIPVAALHRLIPWGLAGYAINIVSGAAFLMTEPDQYIYNPAFQFKILFMAVAGFNALTFYVIAYRRSTDPGASDVPRAARIIAATSLCMWIAVIVCGRLLTFYRPGVCPPEGPGFLADCIPRRR
jgi:cytochrome bd-type quinol oxidase subunit 1